MAYSKEENIKIVADVSTQKYGTQYPYRQYEWEGRAAYCYNRERHLGIPWDGPRRPGPCTPKFDWLEEIPEFHAQSKPRADNPDASKKARTKEETIQDWTKRLAEIGGPTFPRWQYEWEAKAAYWYKKERSLGVRWDGPWRPGKCSPRAD